jgi:NADH-quinone oxidoreductase subunit H
LGGYHAPPGLGFTESWLGGWFTFLWFSIKVVLFFYIFVWLRGTLPRLRYDQFMQFGWKVLIPANVAWIMVVAVLRYLSTNGASRTSILIFGGTALLIFLVGSSLYERVKAKKSEIAESAVDAPAPYPVPELPMKISTFTVPRAERERE